MQTGLSKKQKTTSIYSDEASPIIEVQTHNTDIKNRLTAYAAKYLELCRQTDDDEQGSKTFEVSKGRFGFKPTAPYSEERRKAAGEIAKMENLRVGEKMKTLSCEFNMDTDCMELRLDDGTLITIDTIAVENEVADNMYQRSKMDWLIYNAPLDSVCFERCILNASNTRHTAARLWQNGFSVPTESE